jgi:hypothetical protein
MADVNIYLYEEEPTLVDILLSDPTQVRETGEEEIFVRDGVSIGPYLIV